MSEPKHRAKVRLTPEDLLRLLGAPESVTLRRVIVSDDPEAVDIMIEHSSLPAVYPLCVAPVLDLVGAQEVFEAILQAENYA